MNWISCYWCAVVIVNSRNSFILTHRMNTHQGKAPEDENQDEECTGFWGQVGRDRFGDFRNSVRRDTLVEADILLLTIQ